MDDNTIEHLFVTYADDIHKFLVYFTRNIDVEDLVQETFVKALKGLPNYRKDASLKTWLFSIARGVAIDHFRKTRRQHPVDDSMFSSIAAAGSLTDQVEFNEFYKELLDVLKSKHMKRGYREVVICRALMDMSVNDTAKVLGWTSVRVNVTYHRALKRTRELLGVQMGGVLQNELPNGR